MFWPRNWDSRLPRLDSPGHDRNNKKSVRVVAKTAKIEMEEKSVLTLDESTLIASSRFFKAALSGPWKESDECQTLLHVSNQGVATIFKDWLDRGTLLDRLSRQQDARESFIELFIFADEYQILRFQNDIVDAWSLWCAVNNKLPATPLQTAYVYDNTVEKSILRRFLVRRFIHGIHTSTRGAWRSASFEKICPDFITDVKNELLKQRDLRNTPFMQAPVDHCEFHDHRDEDHKCLTRLRVRYRQRPPILAFTVTIMTDFIMFSCMVGIWAILVSMIVGPA